LGEFLLEVRKRISLGAMAGASLENLPRVFRKPNESTSWSRFHAIDIPKKSKKRGSE